MKRIFTLVSIFVMVFGLSLQAHAILYDRGADSLGYHLIYDSDLNITWYDYPRGNTTWQNQINWADALTVNYQGTAIDDWRLPTTVDGPVDFSYTGTTTAGYNITSSEMGYLFYTDLGNQGLFDTSNNLVSGYGLANTGPFLYLFNYLYWSGTEYATAPGNAWTFDFNYGSQDIIGKNDANVYALAVRSGDIASTAVPEPGTMFLLASGIVGLIAGGRMTRRRHG